MSLSASRVTHPHRASKVGSKAGEPHGRRVVNRPRLATRWTAQRHFLPRAPLQWPVDDPGQDARHRVGNLAIQNAGALWLRDGLRDQVSINDVEYGER